MNVIAQTVAIDIVIEIEIESSMKIGDCHRDRNDIVSAKKKAVKNGTRVTMEVVNAIPATTIIGWVTIRVIAPETVIELEIITIPHSTQTHGCHQFLLQSKCVGSKPMSVLTRKLVIDDVLETNIDTSLETSRKIGDCR